ncbi:MAG: energy transducer TonB [Deltaproteobacteria bacterium]|nr:energy transducer TonB [Deltaproteobacteria bacterium]MBW2536300.1 energy transducer TonB [Deltaproteobacteria bacterium]
MSAARAAELPISTRPRGVLGSDFQPHELILAAIVALVVQVGAGVAIRFAGLHNLAAAPDIDPGMAVPIRVKPMIDLESPLLKLGGKKVKYKLPDQWVRQAPVKRVERKAFPSTKADKSVDAIPPDEVELADAGAEPPEPDAAVALEVDEENVEDSDAGPSNVDTEGSPDGVPEGTETDPLKARAANLYHSRIRSFLTAPFRPHCSNLSKEDFVGCVPSASVQLSSDGVVQSFSFNPCGKSSVDGAAKAALGSIVGQPIPPPPENYPDIRPNSFNVSYVCK